MPVFFRKSGGGRQLRPREHKELWKVIADGIADLLIALAVIIFCALYLFAHVPYFWSR
jgi:hypothetical protein